VHHTVCTQKPWNGIKMTKPQITFYQVHKYQCSVVLFDQVVGVPLFPFSNVISLTLHLSDHIKRLPLFLFSSMRKTWIPSNSSWLLKQAFNLVSKWKYFCQIKFSNNEFLCCLVFICVRKNDNVLKKLKFFVFLPKTEIVPRFIVDPYLLNLLVHSVHLEKDETFFCVSKWYKQICVIYLGAI
jgi:hypothetical protein